MNTSRIEITDNEYQIKLSKEEFDLTFINELMKHIEAEVNFFNSREKSRNKNYTPYGPFLNGEKN